MKVVKLLRPREVQVLDKPAPSVSTGEALVRIVAAGVCGSDMHTYLGQHPFRQAPVVLGHEVAGVVEMLEGEVADIGLGDRVAVMPLWGCGACSYCEADTPQFCARKVVPGAGWPGMMSEYIAAPATALFKLPKAVSFAEGAMVEPCAVALRALRTGDLRPGESLAVLGAGAIGGLVATVGRALGAEPIIVSDIKDYNLELIARVARCYPVNASAQDVVSEGRSVAKDGFDVIVVASGHRTALTEAVSLAKPQSRVVILSLFAGDALFDANDLVLREVQLRGSATYSRQDFHEALALIAEESIGIERLVTQCRSIDSAPAVFDEIAQGLDHVKVLFTLDMAQSLSHSPRLDALQNPENTE